MLERHGRRDRGSAGRKPGPDADAGSRRRPREAAGAPAAAGPLRQRQRDAARRRGPHRRALHPGLRPLRPRRGQPRPRVRGPHPPDLRRDAGHPAQRADPRHLGASRLAAARGGGARAQLDRCAADRRRQDDRPLRPRQGRAAFLQRSPRRAHGVPGAPRHDRDPERTPVRAAPAQREAARDPGGRAAHAARGAADRHRHRPGSGVPPDRRQPGPGPADGHQPGEQRLAQRGGG